jgi:hypothetical protein
MCRAGSPCSASCQRPICSQITLIEREESRPSGRREPIEAADRNSAVDVAPASARALMLEIVSQGGAAVGAEERVLLVRLLPRTALIFAFFAARSASGVFGVIVIDALNAAQRSRDSLDGAIFHSDHEAIRLQGLRRRLQNGWGPPIDEQGRQFGRQRPGRSHQRDLQTRTLQGRRAFTDERGIARRLTPCWGTA